MSTIDPHTLELVRLARGLSQSGLSRIANGAMSQAWISNAETGKISTTEDHAALIAGLIGCPVELLSQPAAELTGGAVCSHFRKRSDLQVTKASQLSALLSITQILMRSLHAPAAVSLPRLTPDDEGFVTPEEIAGQVRDALGVPPGPIDDLGQRLSAAGVFVLAWSFDSERLDALSQWPDDGLPIVLVAAGIPGDRLRYTMAHETAHLVMHELPREQQESEADRFAAEFLMPADQVRGSFHDLSLAKLAALKSTWGTSMAALLRRGRDLGEVPERRYRSLNIELSRAGFRKREPGSIDRDHASHLSTVLSDCPTWVRDSAVWLESVERLTKTERGSE